LISEPNYLKDGRQFVLIIFLKVKDEVKIWVFSTGAACSRVQVLGLSLKKSALIMTYKYVEIHSGLTWGQA
jgi:hypothetical protein